MPNRLDLPPVAALAGYYAVEDPAIPGRLTAWSVDTAGGLHRFGPERWEPLAPSFGGIADPQRRADARSDWYDTTYRAWKLQVIDAIGADPDKAAADFRAAYPTTVAAPKPARGPRASAKLANDLIATLLAAAGANVSATARRTGVARSTVRDRIAAGRALVATRPDTARAVLAERFGPDLREFLPLADFEPVDLDALLALVVTTIDDGTVADDDTD